LVEIETERLFLRPLSMEDAEDLLRLQGDPEMMKFFDDGHTYGSEESRTWLQWHVDMWELEGYGFWAAIHRSESRFLGWIGVTKVWSPPELMPASEVGWFIGRDHWGQGLATEGARQALAFAFGSLQLERVIARYRSDNTASGRVMEKIGMQLWREEPYPGIAGVTTRIYEKTAPQ
jgi:RimJ/RimL family protein N-acetyltransferase